MTTLEVLEEARRKIYHKKNWTTGVYARNINGILCTVHSENARSWCAQGAIMSLGNKCCKEASDILCKVGRNLYDHGIENINDIIGHAAVLRVYKVAIAEAKECPEIDN